MAKGKLLNPLDMLADMAAQDGLQLRELPLSRIHPDPDQPRTEFGGEEDELFAEGIKETGLAQPLLVRPHPTLAGDYMIIVGERRYRAAQRAELENVPCQIRTDLDPARIALLQLAENMGRRKLSGLDTARGMRRALDLDPELTQAALAKKLGCHPSAVNQYLALLNPQRVSPRTREAVEEGRIIGPSTALEFESLPADRREEMLTREAPITRRAIRAAAATATTARPRLVPQDPTQEAPSSPRAARSATPSTSEPSSKGGRGRPRLIERRINAALVWSDWLRLFEKLGFPPPMSADDLDAALRAALED